MKVIQIYLPDGSTSALQFASTCMFIWAMFEAPAPIGWIAFTKIYKMGSKIGFEMSLIIVEAIRGRCASFMSLPATVSEIFGGQTTPSILVV